MTTYDWQQIRASAIRAFGGDAPRNELEQRIIDVFTDDPQLVVDTIDVVTHKYAAGKIQSPWAILDLNLQEARRPGARIVAENTSDRKRRIARAEQWIQNAGIHFDLETEIQDELFDRGLLRDYATDEKLIERMLDHWRAHRPTGEQAEAEAEQRAQDWKQARARIAQMARDRLAALEAELPEPEYALVGETPPPDETQIPEEPQ